MTVLSHEQREFILSLWRDGSQTQAEIADLAGTTQGNVSKVLNRARQHDPEIPRRREATISRQSPRQRFFAASQLGSSLQPVNLDSL